MVEQYDLIAGRKLTPEERKQIANEHANQPETHDRLLDSLEETFGKLYPTSYLTMFDVTNDLRFTMDERNFTVVDWQGTFDTSS